MRTVSSWLRPVASALLTALFLAIGCSSGSGDIHDGAYAAEHGYDAEFAEPNPGEACTRDAVVTCGYLRLGTKICTCAGGVYTQCPCFPPKDWQGELTAPVCDALTATATALRGKTCTNLVGSQCIDRSQPDPAKQEGCSCIKGAAGAQWACGAPSMVGVPDNAGSCTEFETGDENYLKNAPCTNEWQQCIARNFVDGTTQHGCVCLSTNGTLRWACGSTNKWFVPE
jgi:hypothetical protein